jgi:hypothetical protein
MTTTARIIADSIGFGCPRLTTPLARLPHSVLPHVLTHRVFSRSTTSSRAVPIKRMIAGVEAAPYVPREWRYSADRGMQPGKLMSKPDAKAARESWMRALDAALREARVHDLIGSSKEYANRLLEPFSYCSIVISATEWENFFDLRLHEDTQIDTRDLAAALHDAMKASTPRRLAFGDWHSPFDPDPMRSAACCARTSYNRHDGSERTADADMQLADMLRADKHMSPFEHQARVGAGPCMNGNFAGHWVQHRKLVEAEG